MAITTFNTTDSGATIRTTLNDNFTDLDTTKADLASPTFTGNPVAPTQTANDNSTKLATTAYVDAAVSTVTIETTTGVTHSLTTTVGQVVVVWAKGDLSTVGGATTLTLKYNNVTKDTSVLDASSDTRGFALMYTETPGAATANITMTTDVGTLTNVVIIVMKIG